VPISRDTVEEWLVAQFGYNDDLMLRIATQLQQPGEGEQLAECVANVRNEFPDRTESKVIAKAWHMYGTQRRQREQEEIEANEQLLKKRQQQREEDEENTRVGEAMKKAVTGMIQNVQSNRLPALVRSMGLDRFVPPSPSIPVPHPERVEVIQEDVPAQRSHTKLVPLHMRSAAEAHTALVLLIATSISCESRP
jgi:hypothetical protein